MIAEDYEGRVNCDAEPPVGDWYVTCRDGRRVGFLLGPYGDYWECYHSIDRGRELALNVDQWAWFYEFGFSRLPSGTRCKAVFGK